VAKFNTSVAENAKVEMIHLSLDRDEGEAKSWATRAKLPWLTMMHGDVQKTDLLSMFGPIRGVPTYLLVSADGEKVGTGSNVFSKLGDL